MVKWTFRSYRLRPEEGAEEPVRVWLEGKGGVGGLARGAQAAIAGRLSVRAVQELERWEEGRFWKPLGKGLKGMEQLLFEFAPQPRGSPKENYRILGFVDENRHEFTMLYGFQKTRGQLDYDEFGPIALERQRQVRANRTYTVEAKWMNDYD